MRVRVKTLCSSEKTTFDPVFSFAPSATINATTLGHLKILRKKIKRSENSDRFTNIRRSQRQQIPRLSESMVNIRPKGERRRSVESDWPTLPST